MKAILALMLAAAMLMGVAAAGEQVAFDEGNRAGLQLLAQTWDGEHNQIISPASLAIALDMAGVGAAGVTREEIYRVLTPGSAAAWLEKLSGSGLQWANAAFIREDLAVKRVYADTLTRDYAAQRFGLDSVDAVNAWVDEHTGHLIDHLVDEIDGNTRMLLLNALAMDARWKIRFDAADTRADTFHAPGGDAQVDFMHVTDRFAYAQSALGQAVLLPYRDSSLYMLILLPEPGRMAEALAALVQDPAGCFAELSPRKVALSLPKLDICVENKLSDALKAMGIVTAFGDDADFSGISDEALYISDVIQKVRLQLDEEGTRAAAVTEVIMRAKGAFLQEEIAVMKVDRPFIVLIADANSRAVCFAGAVCDPSKK